MLRMITRRNNRKKPLKMLAYAKRHLRLNITKDRLETLKLISDGLKSRFKSLSEIDEHTKYTYRVTSFLPIKGWRIDRDGKKKWFYYLIYHIGPKHYRIRPSVALLAVGSEDYVNQAIDNHLADIRSNNVCDGIPSNFWRLFELKSQETYENQNSN